MNAEKYVKDIVNRLKCTGKKKKEIKNQLLSDIAARREQGEALEQILAGMGSPKEIAEAFCQNLSDAERKAYRRRKIGQTVGGIVIVILFMAALSWWMIPKPAALGDSPSQEEITASVENVIELLNKNDFETLRSISTEKLQPVLTQETIDKVRQNIADDWGEMQSIGKVYLQGIKQKGRFMIVTQVDVIYEQVSTVYTISFDKDLRLEGLYMR
ncbi:MAG: DUF3887 domain-containing protein [Lachnospiraceae bacterium]